MLIMIIFNRQNKEITKYFLTKYNKLQLHRQRRFNLRRGRLGACFI